MQATIIKSKTATREAAFPHALKALTDTEYEQIVLRAGRFGPSQDYLRVNGQPYVVGESAERHGTLTRRSGAARYRPDYYGVCRGSVERCSYERGGGGALRQPPQAMSPSAMS
jgi:hypothetical protein